MTWKERSMITALFVFSISFSVFGQSADPVVPTELELKEAAEEAAGQVWKKEDREIERQVFREALGDFLKRRDRAAETRRRYDAARIVKTEAQLKEAHKEVASLEQFLASGIDAQNEEMEKSVSRQFDRLTEREMSIRQSLGKHEPGLSPERQLLIDEQRQKELEQVVSLRENLFRQKESLERIRKAKTPLIESVQGLLTHARKVSEALDEDAKRVKEEAALWQEYYSGLGKMAQDNAAKKQAKKAEETKSKAQNPPAKANKK